MLLERKEGKMIEEDELLLKNESFFLLENKRKWHTSRIGSKDMPEKRRVNEHLYCINYVPKILPKYGKNVRKSMLILLRSGKRWAMLGNSDFFAFKYLLNTEKYHKVS